MANIEDALLALMGLVSALPGMKSAPDYPPESANAFPFAVAWPGNGRTMMLTDQDYKDLGTLILEIHVARTILPVDVEAVLPYLDLTLKTLMQNPTLSGTVQTIDLSSEGGGITWAFGELDWQQDVKTLGWRLTIPVKREESYL